MNKFEGAGSKQERIIANFEDLRGLDLSAVDLRQSSADRLITSQFDTETKWPAPDKLPDGFNPEKLLEDSKSPGLGLESLHKRGIDGRGVVVAIIDQKLDANHPEYNEAIKSYEEYGIAEEEPISMHGPAVASLLVGKECGVVPGAKLVYKAVPSKPGSRDFSMDAQALEDIIKNNKEANPDEKVRIVSCSTGYNPAIPEAGLSEWISALKKAKEEGIFVVDVSGRQVDVPFVGGGSPEDKNNFESYLPWLYDNKEDDEELNKAKLEGNVDRILKRLREVRKGGLANISDSDLRKEIEEGIRARREELVGPSDYRTMASSWPKKGQYMYEGRGGKSWAVPYLAGLFALALQVNPELRQQEIAEIINETAVVNKKGLKIVNPEGIVEAARKRIIK